MILSWREVPHHKHTPIGGPFWYEAISASGSYAIKPQTDSMGKFETFTVSFANNGRRNRGPAHKYLGDSPDLDACKAMAQEHADRLARGYHDVSKLALDQHRAKAEQSAQARMEDLRKRDGGTPGAPVLVGGVQRGERAVPCRSARGAKGGVPGLLGDVREHPEPDRDARPVVGTRDVREPASGDHGLRDAQSLGYAGLTDLSLKGWIACYWPTRQVVWRRIKIREAIYILRRRRRDWLDPRETRRKAR